MIIKILQFKISINLKNMKIKVEKGKKKLLINLWRKNNYWNPKKNNYFKSKNKKKKLINKILKI